MKKEGQSSIVLSVLAIIIAIIAVLLLMLAWLSFIASPKNQNYYDLIKDHGSLIAAILALFAAIYTVWMSKVLSKKEAMEQERKDVLGRLFTIKEKAFLISNLLNNTLSDHAFKKLTTEKLYDLQLSLTKDALLVKSYLRKKGDVVAFQQMNLIVLNAQLLGQYIFYFGISVNANVSLMHKMNELNNDLVKFLEEMNKTNQMCSSDLRVYLYEQEFLFQSGLGDVASYMALSRSWGLSDRIFERLIIKIDSIDEWK